MNTTVPRDIARRLERRWSARARQAESFSIRTERLKRDNPPCVEGVPSAPAAPDDGCDMPLSPALPNDRA